MEYILKAVIIGTAAAVLSVGIHKTVPEIALLLKLAAAVLILILAFRLLDPILAFAKESAAVFGASGVFVQPVLKTALIGITTGIGASFCKDAGHASAEEAIGIAGTAAALYTALPVFQLFLHTIGELL